MAGIILYPPITSSFMPAFVRSSIEGAKIYFSLSNFNSIEDIACAQLTCISQSKNASILDTKKYPLGIKMTSVKEDLTIQGDNRYYVTILPTELNDPDKIHSRSCFKINDYYKVQIRLVSIEAGHNPEDPSLDKPWDEVTPSEMYGWNMEYLDCFSEWSRVCIIRPIASPYLSLQTEKKDNETQEIEIAELNPEIINIIPNSFMGLQGKLKFDDTPNNPEKEVLHSYNIQLLYDGNVIYNSQNIFVNSEDPNQINYSIGYKLENDKNYTLAFSFRTGNGYQGRIDFPLLISLEPYEEFINTKMFVVPDEENSCMIIRLKAQINPSDLYVDYERTLEDAYVLYANQLERVHGNLDDNNVQDYVTIIRASNKDNYQIWEDIHTEYIVVDENLDYVYLDYTAEAGVLYKYAAQKRDTTGRRGLELYPTEYIKTYINESRLPMEVNEDTNFWYDGNLQYTITEASADPVLFMPEYIHLITNNYNMKVKMNGDISSYKYIFSENSTETIGSQYPFVMRNGNVKYRQFNITGTITATIDLESGEGWNSQLQKFEDSVYEADRKRFYGNDYQYYQKYLNDHNQTPYEDIVYEKHFRDMIIDYLQDGKVKLFKSSPEGNILVRLINISFNPEKSLGRYIYNFQATAIEVAECTIPNYVKYNIITPINYFGGEL